MTIIQSVLEKYAVQIQHFDVILNKSRCTDDEIERQALLRKLKYHFKVLRRSQQRLKTWRSDVHKESIAKCDSEFVIRLELEADILADIISCEIWHIPLLTPCGEFLGDAPMSIASEARISSLQLRVATVMGFGTRHRVTLVSGSTVLNDCDTLAQAGLEDGAMINVIANSGTMLVNLTDSQGIPMYSRPPQATAGDTSAFAVDESAYLGTLECGVRFELIREIGEGGEWAQIMPEKIKKASKEKENDGSLTNRFGPPEQPQEVWIKLRANNGAALFAPLGSDGAKAAARKRFEALPLPREMKQTWLPGDNE